MAILQRHHEYIPPYVPPPTSQEGNFNGIRKEGENDFDDASSSYFRERETSSIVSTSDVAKILNDACQKFDEKIQNIKGWIETQEENSEGCPLSFGDKGCA